ncbi:importin-13, partial [Phenoliferia sp. Uapishka_3]
MEELVHLVQQLYSPGFSETHSVQLRLQEIERSPSGWLVGSLLVHPDGNVRLFAAITLNLKISRDLDQLPPHELASLRNSLLDWISQAAAARERAVIRKLAACIATLSLRTEWPGWLLELMSRVATSGETAREAVLAVLSVAIETVTRADLVGAKRQSYMAALGSSTPHIVSTLGDSLQSDSPAEVNEAIGCLVACLDAGLLQHQELGTLYPLLLPRLSQPETSGAACAAVEEIVERSSGVTSGVGMTRFVNRQKVDELISGWVTTQFVSDTIRQAVEEQEADDDALAVMRLLCAIAEHFIASYLFQPPPAASNIPYLNLTSPETVVLLHFLLLMTNFPGHSGESYNVNELTTGVWMSLQEEASDRGLVSGPGNGREGRVGHEREWEVINPVFVALADGLRGRAKRPPADVVATWPKDVLDGFRVYRSTTLSETILYAYYTLRESMLGGLVSLAEQQLNSSSPDLEVSSNILDHRKFVSLPTSDMKELEAVFFCLYAVHEAVLEDEATHLPRLFSPAILGRIPSEGYPALRGTALRMVGEYAGWFGSQHQACLQAVSFVVPALSDPALCAQAARALRLLCTSNRKTLGEHVGSFVAVLGGLEGKVEDAELVKVLEAVASVVQALPDDKIVEPLLTLTNPIVGKFHSSIDMFGQVGASQTSYFRSLIADLLHLQLPTEARDLCLQQLGWITACAKGLSDPDDDLFDLDTSIDDSVAQRESSAVVQSDPRVAEMRTRLAHAVQGVARTWAGDIEVAQALADYIKHSSSDAIPSPVGLDPLDLLSLASSSLQASLSPVWLSIAASLVARLTRTQNDSQLSAEDLAKVGRPIESALTVALQALSNLRAMDENPDLVQAFLAFCNSIVRNFPRVLAALPNHLDAIFTFAERGLGMQENFSLRANIDLLIISIQQTRMSSSSAVVFAQTVTPHTQSILHSLLLSIAGRVPRSHLTSLSDLLHVFVLRVPDDTRRHLHDLLAQPEWPSAKASPEAKAKFEKSVVGARSGKLVRAAVSDFALVCRGLDGSAYGAASASIFSR